MDHFLRIWAFPAFLACLMVLWLWMEIVDKKRRDERNVLRDAVDEEVQRRLELLEKLPCVRSVKQVGPYRTAAGPINETCKNCPDISPAACRVCHEEALVYENIKAEEP